MRPEAPEAIPLPRAAQPWPFLLVDGISEPAALNGIYRYTPQEGGSWVYEHVETGSPIEDYGGVIAIGDGVSVFFQGEGTWPGEVVTWDAYAGGSGTLRVRFFPGVPEAVPIGLPAPTYAYLETELAGSSNDIVFTARALGRVGNSIRVRYRDPAANNAPLSVTVVGRDITINLATGAGGAITTTAAQIIAAVSANPASDALVTAVLNQVSGSGVVPAMAYSSLAGGSGGLPLPPETLSL